MTSHQAILAVVRRIPRGRVATYGLVAQLAGYARQPRLAGYALRHADDSVPWHRVVNAAGTISPRADPDSVPLQQSLLEAEGVEFDHRYRIDLRRFLWRPRGGHRQAAKRSKRSPSR
jgi:methylated-DNA-protein-cysteine methyltransferase-like protein